MQIAFMAILVLALLATVVSFLVMGIRQHRRAGRLARQAMQRGLHFSREDPFEIPERYREFALLSCGHSPRASHVIHGQLDSWPVRAFDFRYEIGHGARRVTRRYGAIVIDLQRDVPDVLLWNDADADHAPLDARQAKEHVGRWSVCGEPALAEIVQHASMDPAGPAVSLQVRRGLLLLCLPITTERGWDDSAWMDWTLRIATLLRDTPPTDPQNDVPDKTNVSGDAPSA